jgi:hypothetical protein
MGNVDAMDLNRCPYYPSPVFCNRMGGTRWAVRPKAVNSVHSVAIKGRPSGRPFICASFRCFVHGISERAASDEGI